MVMALDKTTNDTPSATHEKLGPYENWMMDVGKFYDLPGMMLDDSISLSCVAEFGSENSYDQFKSVSKLQAGTSNRLVMVPTLHKDKGFEVRFIPFLLAPDPDNPSQKPILNRIASEIEDNFSAPVNPDGPFGQKAQLRLNLPVRQDTVNTLFDQNAPLTTTRDPALNGGRPKVILAIIDLGIPFAHANFRHSGTNKTRIDYCWVQSSPAVQGSNVLFGREFSRDDIDALVIQYGIDEDAIYAQSGVLSKPGAPPMPLSRMHSHGAHVLDTLAGRWDHASEAEARIIAVDLPASSTWETSGFGKDMFILSALHYIFSRAYLINQEYGGDALPLVINLSYGYSGGPHDGTGLIEDAIAELVGKRKALAPTFIVMPSGNMFQDRLFAQITDAHFQPSGLKEKVASLQWFAPPTDRTSSYIEFWYPPGVDLRDVIIELTTPAGLRLPVWQADLLKSHFASNLQIDGNIVGQFTIDRSRKIDPTSRVRATVILAPTEAPAKDDYRTKTAPSNPHAPAPAGIWTVRFFWPAAKPMPASGIECRIQRDTSYGQGNTGAQQGYFIDPKSPRYDCMGKLATTDSTDSAAKLRRFGSMNGMATHTDTLVVGGHVIGTETAAVYSSAGPIGAVDGQVDISAASERSVFMRGMTAAGTRSGITVAFQGTSTSAPQVARALGAALMDHSVSSVDECLALLAQAGVTKPVTDLTNGPGGQVRLGQVLLTTTPPVAGSEQVNP